MKINEIVTIRDFRTFVSLIKGDRTYFRYRLKDIEIHGFLLMDIERISKYRWQVRNIVTGDNSYNLDEENIILTSSNFNTKALLEAKPYTFYNTLGMEITEHQVAAEA